MNIRMSSLFNERKAAEVAAYFLICARQRHANISLLKLMKLMYLAERFSYGKYALPLTGDALVSMPHGPVLSRTLDLITVGDKKEAPAWFSLITEKIDKHKYMVLTDENLTTDRLQELSDADIDILDLVWRKFGRMSAKKLESYTHDPEKCPEWQDPDGSSIPIHLQTLLKHLGYTDNEITRAIANLQKQACLNTMLS